MPTPSEARVAPSTPMAPARVGQSDPHWRSVTEYPTRPPEPPPMRTAAKASSRAPRDGAADGGVRAAPSGLGAFTIPEATAVVAPSTGVPDCGRDHSTDTPLEGRGRPRRAGRAAPARGQPASERTAGVDAAGRGVVDPGETTTEALGREVREETGLIVDEWSSVVYEVSVDFPDRDMVLDVGVYLAESWHGEMVFDDPDGIVEDGRFVSAEEGRALLASAPTWVDEPVGTWLAGGVGSGGRFEYLVRGTDPGGLTVERR
ncbi:MAG: hypothetical protein DSY73_03735 [Actinobacteria bacterium]|nr:MAG: hypothetical protein DSY73_03735 [Actinomycetota bacterium]